jgi:hypothetical protein
MGLDVSSKIIFTKVVSFPLEITMIYFIIGALWILLSDKIPGVLVRDPTVLTNVSIVKGWFYVSVTALMLYVLISRVHHRSSNREKRPA